MDWEIRELNSAEVKALRNGGLPLHRTVMASRAVHRERSQRAGRTSTKYTLAHGVGRRLLCGGSEADDNEPGNMEGAVRAANMALMALPAEMIVQRV